MRLRCGNCNYKFIRDKVPNKCPYCAEQALMEEEDSASLIKEELCFD